MKQLLEESLRIPESDNIAKLMFHLYRTEFTCTSIKQKKWKYKQNDRLIDIEEGYVIFNRISTDIYKQFEKLQIDIEEEINKLRKENQNIEITEKIRNLVKKVQQCEVLFRKLKNLSFKTKIMKEAAMLFLYNDI
jgi:hypothetical protein